MRGGEESIRVGTHRRQLKMKQEDWEGVRGRLGHFSISNQEIWGVGDKG